MTIDELKQLVINSLEDLKAEDITVFDVQGKTTMTDWLVIATGSSSRHVKSLANSVAVDAKNAGKSVLGSEGEVDGEWVLVDFGDVIVHVMQRQVREYYDLESLWSIDVINRQKEAEAN